MSENNFNVEETMIKNSIDQSVNNNEVINKKKRNNGLTIILVLIIIGLLTYGGLDYFGVIDFHQMSKDFCLSDIQNNDNSKKEFVEISDYTSVNSNIRVLYDIVRTHFYDTNDGKPEANFYQGKQITKKDVLTNQVIANSINPESYGISSGDMLKNTTGSSWINDYKKSPYEVTISIFDYEKFNNRYQNFFGQDEKAPFESFDYKLMSCGVDKNDKSFKCIESDGGFIGDFRMYTKFVKAEDNGDEFIVYDKMTACDYSSKYHGNNETYECHSTVVFDDGKLLKDDVKITDSTIYPDDFDNFAQEYKHTFKKNSDGTYYWYSSELAK